MQAVRALPARRSWLGVDAKPGGRTAPENLITLCGGCNASRGARPIEAFDPVLAFTAEEQTAKPIDRAAGLELARKLWPLWDARIAKARAKYETKRKERKAA